MAQRDPRRAVPLARRALEMLQTSDPLARAWARYTLGWALLCWERFVEARVHLQDARSIFEAGDARYATLRCRHALLLADLMQFARPDLEHDFTALATQFEQIGASRDAARVWLYQAILLDILGRTRDAEDILTQIASAISCGDPIDRARWLYIRGAVAISRAAYSQAEALLEQADQSFAALHNPLERARCWFQQAWAALRQEKLDQALASYRHAEQVFARLNLPVRLALCNKAIGLVLTRMGAYDDALRMLLQALQLFTGLNRTNEIGACHLNLGNVYFYSGLWDAALACYIRAEELYAEGSVVGEQIIAQRNRAMVYRAQRRHDEAQRLLVQVEAQAQLIGDQTEVAEAWSLMAGILADMDQSNEAAILFQRAQVLFTHLGNIVDAAECQVNQGWLALRHESFDRAQAFFRSAAPIVFPHSYYRWRVDYGLARCCEAYDDTEQALSHYRAACATIAELRRQLANEEISSSLYTQAAQLYADALRLAVQHGAVETAVEFGEGQRALVLQRLLAAHAAPLPVEYEAQCNSLQMEIAAILDAGVTADGSNVDRLDAVLAAYGDLLLRARHSAPSRPVSRDAPTAFDLVALREHLNAIYGADWTALSYMPNGDTMLIGVVTPEGATLERTANDNLFQRLIAQATLPLYRRYTYLDLPYYQGQNDSRWADLRILTDRLLPQAVRARLHPDHRLLIVPAGPLHALPWPMLRLDQGWLAEQAVVQIAPSLVTWQALANRAPARGAGALLIGCSEYGTRAPILPAVGAELAAVAVRWPGVYDQLLDTLATRAALMEQSECGRLAEYELLHFAGHARLLPTRGQAAHLKLWDGDLLLAEVAGLRLHGALVVLSACDGAAADVLPGEEVLSLTWAFLAAGANGVLANLWPIEDGAAEPIMAALYDTLREHGDAALGLALAQRRLIAASSAAGDLEAEPLAWGGFVLTGIGRLPR